MNDAAMTRCIYIIIVIEALFDFALSYVHGSFLPLLDLDVVTGSSFLFATSSSPSPHPLL